MGPSTTDRTLQRRSSASGSSTGSSTTPILPEAWSTRIELSDVRKSAERCPKRSALPSIASAGAQAQRAGWFLDGAPSGSAELPPVFMAPSMMRRLCSRSSFEAPRLSVVSRDRDRIQYHLSDRHGLHRNDSLDLRGTTSGDRPLSGTSSGLAISISPSPPARSSLAVSAND